MPDIIELIDCDHRRIRRLLSAMTDLVHQPGAPRHARGLWGRVNELLMMHMAAEDEIWYPALYQEGQRFRTALPDCAADHDDIREVLAEATLQADCSRPWWLAVDAAAGMVTMHLAREEALIEDLAANMLDQTSCDQLGARWHRFAGAWVRDAELPASPPIAHTGSGRRLARAWRAPSLAGQRDSRAAS